MAQEIINVGLAANDRSGDDWRVSMIKANNNFTSLFSASTYLADKDDVLANGVLASGIITMNAGSYTIGIIDLGTDVMTANGNTIFVGNTAQSSSLTTNSASPTITFENGGFQVSGMFGIGGIGVHNLGGGAAVRVDGGTTLCFLEKLLTSSAGTACEVNDAFGFSINTWSVFNAINGLVMTGAANNGPIIERFNPAGVTGKGIDVQGDIVSGALRIEKSLISSIDHAVEVSGNIQGMVFDGDAESTNGNGMKITGLVAGGLLLDATNILSINAEGMDITGGEIAALIGSSAGITAIASGMPALKGNAQSDTSVLPNGGNITAGGEAILSICQINNPVDLTVDPLSGITKKDLQYHFISAGARITDSADIGGFTLDAQTNTAFGFQGFDGTNTAYADSLTAPGVRTLVTSTGHSLADGTYSSIVGTTSYNGLHLVSNVLVNSYEIPVVFVADDATGDYQSGWIKVAGATTDVEAIERFNGLNDNEIELLDSKTLPLTYTAIISGEKSGSTGRLVQFGLFLDSGSGFTKIDGEATIDATNRLKTTTLRVPFEMSTNDLATIYCRNTEGTETFICDGLSVDIGIS